MALCYVSHYFYKQNENILEAPIEKRMHTQCTGCIHLKGKKNPQPRSNYLEHSHSMRSSKDRELGWISSWRDPQDDGYGLQVRESLRDWSKHCNTTKFLQLCLDLIVQHKQKGVAL